MSDLMGDGHEEKLAELAAENDFAAFARPVEVAFDTAWTLAKKKAVAALEAKDREIEALRAERDALREALQGSQTILEKLLPNWSSETREQIANNRAALTGDSNA